VSDPILTQTYQDFVEAIGDSDFFAVERREAERRQFAITPVVERRRAERREDRLEALTGSTRR
jgi:hypothetical protein